jgi:hypothetical protein
MTTKKNAAAKKPAAKKAKLVIVRTVAAGVHYGKLVSKSGDEVVLDGARRIYYWQGANTLSEMSLTGLNSTTSKVAKPVDAHIIKGWIEILPCSAAAAATIDAAKWAGS